MSNVQHMFARMPEDSVQSKEKSEKDEGIAIPIPLDVVPPKHPQLGYPVQNWVYKTQEGYPLLAVCRFVNENGEKQDRPLTYRKYSNGRFGWAWKSLSTPRPLYNLDHLASYKDKTILVCEGEKAAEAAGVLFPQYTVTTSPNGAGSPHCADWSVCKAREVIVWPDNDDEGLGYAEKVAELALKAGATSVHIVQIPEHFPEKWDLADPPPESYEILDLQNLIDNASSVCDPHDALIEESKTNPGAPFKKENLKLLSQLQEFDPCAYEQLRYRLKTETSVRTVELDKTIKRAGGPSSPEQNQIDILLTLASELELFHSPDRNAYADVVVNNRRQTWPVKSKAFKHWLIQQFYEETETAPNAESLNAAINALFAKALFKSPQRHVYIRTASLDGSLYIDLCDEEWSVVRIDANGWEIVYDYPVRFLRSAGMLSLPTPGKSGNIHILRSVLNITEESIFVLTVSWLLGALRYSSQYPILVVMGEYGSAKTSFCEFFRRIVDPNFALLRTLPATERDLYISSVHGYVLGFDNISTISDSMSDALCRIATGGGYSTRSLYTDDEEKLFSATRPIIMNGIEDIAKRSDLVDRCITVVLGEIPGEKRKLKEDVEKEFEAALPQILGGLFTAMSHGLKNLPNIQRSNLPRMADFARWICACEKALWPEGTFMDAYDANRLKAMEVAIESCSVARAIIELMDSRTVWTGSATDFIAHFKDHMEFTTANDWPKNPEGVSGAIRRMAAPLRAKGIHIKTGDREANKGRKRLMEISKPLKMSEKLS